MKINTFCRSRAAVRTQRCAARRQDRGSKWSHMSPAGLEERLHLELDHWGADIAHRNGADRHGGNAVLLATNDRNGTPNGRHNDSFGETTAESNTAEARSPAASPMDLRFVGVKRAPGASAVDSPHRVQTRAFPSMRTDPKRELAGIELASPFRSVLSPINAPASPAGGNGFPRVRSFQAALLQGASSPLSQSSSSPNLAGSRNAEIVARTAVSSPLAIAFDNASANQSENSAPARKSTTVYSVLTDLSAATIATENIIDRVHLCLYTKRDCVSAADVVAGASGDRQRSCRSIFDDDDDSSGSEEEDDEEEDSIVDGDEAWSGDDDDDEIAHLRKRKLPKKIDTTNYKSLKPKVTKDWLRKTLTPFFYFIVPSHHGLHSSRGLPHNSRSFGFLTEAAQCAPEMYNNRSKNQSIGKYVSALQSPSPFAPHRSYGDSSCDGLQSDNSPSWCPDTGNYSSRYASIQNTIEEDLGESEDVALARQLGKIIVPLYPKRIVPEPFAAVVGGTGTPVPVVVGSRRSPAVCATPRSCASPSNDMLDGPREFVASHLLWTPTRPSGSVYGTGALQRAFDSGADLRNYSSSPTPQKAVDAVPPPTPGIVPEDVLQRYVPNQLVVSMVESICQADERVTSFSTQFLKALYRRCANFREVILTTLRRVVKSRMGRSLEFEAERSLLVHSPRGSVSLASAICPADLVSVNGGPSRGAGSGGSSQPKRDHLLSVLDLLEFMISVPCETDDEKDVNPTSPAPCTPNDVSQRADMSVAPFSVSESLMIVVLDCLMCYGSGLGMGPSADGIYEQPQQLNSLTRCLDALVARLPVAQCPVWAPGSSSTSLTGLDSSRLSYTGQSPLNTSLNMSLMSVPRTSWTENGLNLIFCVLKSLLKRWPTGVGVGPCEDLPNVSHNAANSVREDAYLSLLGRLLCHPLVVNSVYMCCCFCSDRANSLERSFASLMSPATPSRGMASQAVRPRLAMRRDWDLQVLHRCLFKLSAAVESIHFKVALRALDILCTSGLYSVAPVAAKSQSGYNMYNRGVENPQLLFLYYLPSPSETVAKCMQCTCGASAADTSTVESSPVTSECTNASRTPGRAPVVCERRRTLEDKKSARLDALVASLRNNRKHWNVSVARRSEELMDFLMDTL